MHKVCYSIIIPTNTNNTAFCECLQALSEHDNSEDIEVIIVADGILIKESFFDRFNLPGLQFLSLPENRGPAYARNKGAEIAKGDVLFFIDADVIILADTMNKIRLHFQTPYSSEGLIGSYDDQPKHEHFVSRFRNLLHHYVHQVSSEKANTFWTACGAIRKSVFDEVGGFDDSFLNASVEDIEFGYRVIQNQYRIKLNKSVQVKHLKRWTLFTMIRTDIFLRAVPWTILLHRYQHWQDKDLNISDNERMSVVSLGIILILLFLMPLDINFLYPAICMVLILLWLKRSTYLFFFRYFKMKLPFAILLHWVYLLSAATGWLIGTTKYMSKKI